jgi:hypothetical protein
MMFNRVERVGIQPLPANQSCWRFVGRRSAHLAATISAATDVS